MLCLLLAAALAASPHPPLAKTLADADADGVPDAVGRVVVVAGRASVASGGLGANAPDLFVQDATGGVRIDRHRGPAVALGDSVVAVGRLAFRDGLAVLDGPRLRVVRGPRRPPAPVAYPSRAPEQVEGRLVAVEAVVAGRNAVEAGDALLLSLPDGALLVAFVFHDRAAPIPHRAYAPGDRVRIVGVAGQYDRAAPYRDSYQIYPRAAQDIRRVGIPAGMYRTAALAALGLLGLVLLWATMLRRQVARRVAQLQGSEDRYRRLVERASDAVVVHDLVGTHVELNAAARRAFGLSPGAVVAQLATVVAPSDLDAARAHMATLVETGHARSDIRVVRADGTDGVYEFESQTIALDGRTRVLSLARDVGARRAYEQGLVEAREAAEETVRVKGAFLASMSHEIRTPLTAVIGFADLLRDEVGEEQRDLVEAIEAGGRRLLSTLNSVLDLARLDAARETLRPTRLDLASHVGQSLHLLGSLATRKGIELRFVPTTAPLWACLDAGALDRVLVNLVGNAIKFTDRGGVTVTVASDGETVRLAVTDTGIGMSPGFLPEVFDEFR
ncbi:MAG TPA: histidine kinase dimerization/phospho-acceptor domain-containing protein, partial [Rubricoccaceae bacterium]